MPRSLAARSVTVSALLAGVLAGCSTQRWPPPMEPTTLPLPPGEGTDLAPGLEEVEVIRHSDPVSLRRAGANAAFPMRFWDKKERARAGAWVLTDSGGRAELLWPRDGTSVVLFEEGAAQLGERDRGEPAVRLRQISRVRLQLGPDVLVELEGGAIFAADGQEVTGPFVIERLPVGDILRVFNTANDTARIEYRDSILTVGPGQVIDVPVLSAGAEPFRRSAREIEQVESGIALRVEGPVFAGALVDGAVSIEAKAGARVEAQGVRVRLDSGERVHFAKLENYVVPLTSENADELQRRIDTFNGVEIGPEVGEGDLPSAGPSDSPTAEELPESPPAEQAPELPAPETAEALVPPAAEGDSPPALESGTVDVRTDDAAGPVPAPDQTAAESPESDPVQGAEEPTTSEGPLAETGVAPPGETPNPRAAMQALRADRARRSLVAATALSNPTLLPQRSTGLPLLLALGQSILRNLEPSTAPEDPDSGTGSDR